MMETPEGATLSTVVAGFTRLHLAISDLMRRGWTVYRAEHEFAPFDLVVYRKDEGLRKVEVRHGRRLESGTLAWNKDPDNPPDFYAVVADDDDSVNYFEEKP